MSRVPSSHTSTSVTYQIIAQQDDYIDEIVRKIKKDKRTDAVLICK